MGGIDKGRLKIGNASILEITTKSLSFQLDKIVLNANGDVNLGNESSDTVTITAHVDSDIVPLAPSSGQPADRHNLGSPNDKWGIVYATEFYATVLYAAIFPATEFNVTVFNAPVFKH